MRKRLSVYHAQTAPLVDYYKEWMASGDDSAPRYIKVDGIGTVAQIKAAIFDSLHAVHES